MPDPLSPEEIDKLNSKCSEIFQDDPITAFCCSRLLHKLSEQWDSGQMHIDWYNELMPIKTDIEKILSLPLPEAHDLVGRLLIKAHEISPILA